MTPYHPIEPDNEQACKHFVEDLDDDTYTAFIACIGSPAFNETMKWRLREIFQYLKYNMLFKKTKVLELMAGIGRNYEVLRNYFTNIEMLEQSESMYKHIHKSVHVRKVKIQEFKWPKEEYDCVVGVWCLCYLSTYEYGVQIKNIEESLQIGGHLILFEPVLSKREPQ